MKQIFSSEESANGMDGIEWDIARNAAFERLISGSSQEQQDVVAYINQFSSNNARRKITDFLGVILMPTGPEDILAQKVFSFLGKAIAKGAGRVSIRLVKYFGKFVKKEVVKLLTKEEFIVAINKGEQAFYVGIHKELSPRKDFFNVTVESHHGVNSVWMKAKFVNYVEGEAPSVFMLNNHNSTRGVFNSWIAEIAKKQSTTKALVDYSKISESEMIQFAEKQFDAANVPKFIRDVYYKNWNIYKSKLTAR